MRASLALKRIFVAATLLGVVGSQFLYDRNIQKNPPLKFPSPSEEFVRVFDLGLDSAAAAFFWVDSTIIELPFLKYGLERYLKDLGLINDLDPRFSFPYYWSVLVLPNPKQPETIEAAIKIGERGAHEADEDWRVSFFLAVTYHLYKNDRANAAKYFDMAAHDAAAPFYIKRFSENYGIAPNAREQTKQVWAAVYKSAGDEETRNRALAYIHRLDTFTFLEQTAQIYRQKYGKLPKEINDLVAGKILSSIPPDPFGFEFYVYPDGTVGIKK